MIWVQKKRDCGSSPGQKRFVELINRGWHFLIPFPLLYTYHLTPSNLAITEQVNESTWIKPQYKAKAGNFVWNYRSPLMLRLIGSLCCNDDNERGHGQFNNNILELPLDRFKGEDRNCGTASTRLLATAKLIVVAAFNAISFRQRRKENGPRTTTEMDSSISTRQSHFISLALILPQPKSDNIYKDEGVGRCRRLRISRRETRHIVTWQRMSTFRRTPLFIGTI